MTRGDRLIGRGIARGGPRLRWRRTWAGGSSSTLGGVPAWLAARHVAGRGRRVRRVSATLVWALWRVPEVRRGDAAPARSGPSTSTSWCAVRGRTQRRCGPRCWPRAAWDRSTCCDLDARPEIATLALEADAVYVATDAEDLDGLRSGAARAGRPDGPAARGRRHPASRHRCDARALARRARCRDRAGRSGRRRDRVGRARRRRASRQGLRAARAAAVARRPRHGTVHRLGRAAASSVRCSSVPIGHATSPDGAGRDHRSAASASTGASLHRAATPWWWSPRCRSPMSSSRCTRAKPAVRCTC